MLTAPLLPATPRVRLGTGDMPDKASAIDSAVDLLSLYPANARIFLNTWTWGYEPLLLALLARWPNEKVHVDRYKRGVYLQLGEVKGGELEPIMGRIVGGKSGFVEADVQEGRGDDGLSDENDDGDNDDDEAVASVRPPKKAGAGHPVPAKLHACDSHRRCEATWRQFASGSRARFGDEQAGDRAIVVAVNPAEMRLAEWDLYEHEVRRRLARAGRGEGEWPISLVRPPAPPFSFVSSHVGSC
jgi:hypothetical protein